MMAMRALIAERERLLADADTPFELKAHLIVELDAAIADAEMRIVAQEDSESTQAFTPAFESVPEIPWTADDELVVPEIPWTADELPEGATYTPNGADE